MPIRSPEVVFEEYVATPNSCERVDSPSEFGVDMFEI
jgi:hypothetical protein